MPVKRQQSSGTGTSQDVKLGGSSPMDPIDQFTEFWAFMNQAIESCGPSKQGPSSAIRKYLIGHIIKTFFQGFFIGKLSAASDDFTAAALLDYLASLLRQIRNDRLFSAIMDALFLEMDVSQSFCKLLSRSILSKKEKVRKGHV